MALARFYNGETAEAHDVGVRPAASELVIYRPADSTVLARWPVGDIVVTRDK